MMYATGNLIPTQQYYTNQALGIKLKKKTSVSIEWASWKKGLNLRINSLPSNLHDEILETWVK